MKPEKMATQMLDRLAREGASEAEVFLEQGARLKIQVRQQKVEYLKQENFQGMGLRVYAGQRMAFVDTTDFSEKNLDLMAKKAFELAELTGEDSANGLPREGGTLMSREVVDRGIFSIPVEDKMARILETERLAMDFDPLITLSNGASYSDLYRTVTIVNSLGLKGGYEETKFSIEVSVVATQDDSKKDGWDSCHRRMFEDLRSSDQMAWRAGEMAVSLVGGKPVPSQEVPVVFDARAGKGLIGGLAGAINGKAVWLGNSFLAEKREQTVASRLVTIIDDGTLIDGVGSSPVDDEGIATRRKVIVDEGVLRSFLYDSYAARKAGFSSTGNGIRGSYQSLPGIGVTNLYMVNGNTSAKDIIKHLRKGLYVVETIGFGANTTTGSYSAGAFGRWIEDGKLGRPVAQVTIAGNLLDIMASVDAVGDDLDFNGRICCPSFRVSKMTVAGT